MSARKKPENKDEAEQHGMDMSLPGAAERWHQILSWVCADLATDNPEFGGAMVSDSWKPHTEEERIEEQFLRKLLLANTAEAIGAACCPSFCIKGLVSPEDDKKFGAVGIDEAFCLLAMIFQLTEAEAYQVRQFADTLNEKAPLKTGSSQAGFVCAEKFNIIRQAVETVQLIADLSDQKGLVEDVVTAARRDNLDVIKQVLAEQERARTADQAITRAHTGSAPATATAQLESEIIRILNHDFPDLKARPTASEFYQEHVINGRSMAELANVKNWKLRTLKSRKFTISKHLSRKFGMPVDLNELRTAPRKSGRITYTDPHMIERTHSDRT